MLEPLFYLSIGVLGGILGYLVRDIEETIHQEKLVKRYNETLRAYHAAQIVIDANDLEHEYQDAFEQLGEREQTHHYLDRRYLE